MVVREFARRAAPSPRQPAAPYASARATPQPHEKEGATPYANA